ncbi:MAG: fibronectin type III domain-containing protein, partial [Lachnospiraceae bacterium]|nr:fibronectin type III domain-containing protein [Lachnospiraceae bacterium]
MVLLLGSMYVVPVEAAAAKEYVLDASTLTEGTMSSDQTAGTDNYFTLKSTSKTFSVDAKNRTFEIDGASVSTTKRLKTGGDGNATGRAIAFTVTDGTAATIHISAESSSSGKLATAVLYNADTQEAVGDAYKTNIENAGTVFTWEELEAGNYYIISEKQSGVSEANVTYRYLKVVETPLSVTKEYVLDASTLTEGTMSSDQTAGTDNYFTLKSTSKTFSVDAKNRTFEIDGASVSTTKRLKTGGDGNATGRAIAFTVTDGMVATIHISAESSSSGKLATAVLYNADTQEAVGDAYKTNIENAGTVFTWEELESGNYYIISEKQSGVSEANVTYRYLKVVETTAGASVKAPSVSGADATLEGDIVTVSANGIPGSEGSKYVVEATTDVSGEWIQSGTAEGNTDIANVEIDLSGEKYGSGTWYFRVYGKGTQNSATLQAANSVTYTLPLGITEIAVQPADGQVSVTFDAVREAESYKVEVYDAQTAGNVVGSVTVAADAADTEGVITGLTNGVKYWAQVTVIRGSESTVSERVAFRPYKAVDSSNAIPGLAIASTNGADPIILRENGNITISQTASSGGMNSAGTVENVTFVYLDTPVAAGTDFTITANVTITGGSNTGSAGGVFLGASTKAEEGAKYVAMGLRGNNSISAYRCKADGTAGGSSDTNKWVAGETYTLTATRVQDAYTVTVSKGTDINFSKSYPATDLYAGLNGDTVYPAILLNGVNADITDIKITVDGVVVYDSTTLTGEVNPFEDNWAIADVPVLQNPVVDNENQKITVVCEGEVGITGAGSIAVDMMNEAGKVVDTQTSSAFGQNTHTLTFNPEDSGVYTFKATASRPGEETVKESNTVTSEKFILALAGTKVVAFNKDNGAVKLVWDAVKEATGYNIYYKLKDDASYPVAPAVANTQDLNCQITGLTAGNTYTFCVKAVRDGEEAKVESTIDKMVSNEVEREWYFAAFGSSTNKDNNGYSGSVADGEVSIWSLGGRGKLVPNSTDGLAFYYTAMDPETENFTLSADITVNEWTYSNGQEGFGIMAADRVGTTGDSSAFWNNSYMATVTKVEYYYDAAAQAVSDSGTKYSMKLGVGSQEKKGVTAELLDLFNVNDTETVNNYFKNEMTTLDTTAPKAGCGAGTYNIVGNYTKEPAGTIADQLTFHLEVKRNNTGYIVSYTNEAGETVSQKYYHSEKGDELLQIDEDNIYIGFYASRNAKITVNNISLTTIHPDEDAPAEERPVTMVTPSYAITSANISNSADYQMVYYGNADGTLVIKDANGNEVVNTHVNALEHFRANTTLTKGVNEFVVKFTPDADYKPSKYEVLSSYEAKEFTHKVTYEVSERNIIYIAPNGVAGAAGTKEEPMDVYTAVRIVAP